MMSELYGSDQIDIVNDADAPLNRTVLLASSWVSASLLLSGVLIAFLSCVCQCSKPSKLRGHCRALGEGMSAEAHLVASATEMDAEGGDDFEERVGTRKLNLEAKNSNSTAHCHLPAADYFPAVRPRRARAVRNGIHAHSLPRVLRAASRYGSYIPLYHGFCRSPGGVPAQDRNLSCTNDGDCITARLRAFAASAGSAADSSEWLVGEAVHQSYSSDHGAVDADEELMLLRRSQHREAHVT